MPVDEESEEQLMRDIVELEKEDIKASKDTMKAIGILSIILALGVLYIKYLA